MYEISTTRQFERSLSSCIRKGKRAADLWDVVAILAENGSLPEEFSPHMLTGIYAGRWECHIEDDWLLVWRQDNNRLTLLLTDTGTHKDLFG